MNATDLIKALQKLVEEHGDLEVECNKEFLYSIEDVKFFESHTGRHHFELE